MPKRCSQISTCPCTAYFLKWELLSRWFLKRQQYLAKISVCLQNVPLLKNQTFRLDLSIHRQSHSSVSRVPGWAGARSNSLIRHNTEEITSTGYDACVPPLILDNSKWTQHNADSAFLHDLCSVDRRMAFSHLCLPQRSALSVEKNYLVTLLHGEMDFFLKGL